MLTIGRIVIVAQEDGEVPAIVSEVNGRTCCLTSFPPRRTPITVIDVPWFETREKAYAHRATLSAQNTKVAYLPYHQTGAPLVSLEQVTSEVRENERQIAALLSRPPETAEEWAAARPDLQDSERGRTLPPITGRLNVPIDPVMLRR